MGAATPPFPGRCTCGACAYELRDTPLFVHACHCRWCQRETGSAFVLNGLIESHRVRITAGAPVVVTTPSESGQGQLITRCPTCMVALWSVYSGAGARFLFVRMGTLDNPDRFPPDIHIYTESKQSWLPLPANVPVMDRYYRRSQLWPQAALDRREATLAMDDSTAAGPLRA
ncbi:MAG: aldehyde-activating protein [Rhodobacteraceae bacterium]|nr:aldehyde-activating protein [Paracoccaceae bacterium]MAY45043.1 aldehyde-activating protein [Paracoccaceae bacterium]|tara:strand:- start:1 stop:516 length:516 start_codon:yes stop_codon:yes gene_type:complete